MFLFSRPGCTWKTVRRLRFSCGFLVASFIDISLNKKITTGAGPLNRDLHHMVFLFSKLCCNLLQPHPPYLRVDEGNGGGVTSPTSRYIKAQYLSMSPGKWWIFDHHQHVFHHRLRFVVSEVELQFFILWFTYLCWNLWWNPSVSRQGEPWMGKWRFVFWGGWPLEDVEDWWQMEDEFNDPSSKGHMSILLRTLRFWTIQLW